MKTKNLCILLLVLFFCSLMPLSALAKLKAESQTPEDVQHGKPWVRRDKYTNSFDQLRVPVSSSGASKAVKYRVTAMQFTIHGYTAYYDAIGTEVIPGPGQTVKQTIVINAADLAQKMGVGAQQVEQWLNTGDKVYISSTVEIHQGDKVLGTYNDYESLAAAMRSYGFPEYDIQDAATRWGEADDPQPPQAVNPGSGLSGAISLSPSLPGMLSVGPGISAHGNRQVVLGGIASGGITTKPRKDCFATLATTQ